MKKTDLRAYWRAYSHDTFALQRMANGYVFLREPHPTDNIAASPCEVVELPLKASDLAFVRAMEKILRPLKKQELRSLAAKARKLPYYRDIKVDPSFHTAGGIRYNLLSAQGATIHFQIYLPSGFNKILANHDCLQISASWKDETAHLEEMPPDSDPLTVVRRLREIFDIAARHPQSPFRFGTDITMYRVDDQYFFHDMRLVRKHLHNEAMHRLPAKISDEKLGAELLDAISRTPQLSEQELARKAIHSLHWRAVLRSVRARLMWDGQRTPSKLSFGIMQSDGLLEKIVTVPVNAKAAAIGKMVRKTIAAKLAGNQRGIGNEPLFERLQRAGFFDLCKRKAAVRRKFLELGWQAIVEPAIQRCFMADSEDLAEGGFGDFLRDAKPFFDSVGVKPGKVRDELRSESYDVWVDGKCYPILIPDDFDQHESVNIWGIATYRASVVLNLLLKRQGRKELAYSMSGGNEHQFIFLTPEMHALIERARGYEKRSGPYRSTGDAPFYGMVEY
jgi:hypothetical protein